MKTKEEIRELIHPSSHESFDDMTNERIVGASNHIRIIGEFFKTLVEHNSVDQASERMEAVSRYFNETRGKSSYAIHAFLTDFDKFLESADRSSKDVFKEQVFNEIDGFDARVEQKIQKLIGYALLESASYKRIMLYDYSSTVNRFVKSLPDKIDIYIPESRLINGGYPFVPDSVKAGHHVHFLADAGLETVMPHMDAVYIGVETFYYDGTAFNTTGSDIAAILAHYHHVPYYALTLLSKFDPRSIRGVYKDVIAKDMKPLLSGSWQDQDLAEKVNFMATELVGVPGKFIYRYITEKGIFLPSHLPHLLNFPLED